MRVPGRVVRETGARTDHAPFAPARSSPPCACAAPARCVAFADERRIAVGGDGGGAQNAGGDNRVQVLRQPSSLRVTVPAVRPRLARLERERIIRSSHRCAHRHSPLRCARALRRVRRRAARRCRQRWRPCASSPSVRVPGRVVRCGRCGVLRPRPALHAGALIAEAAHKQALQKRVPGSASSVLADGLRPVEWPPTASRFPPSDRVREAGARTDNAPSTPSCSSPAPIARRPRVAARSPMSGASLAADEGRARVHPRVPHGLPGFDVRASAGRAAANAPRFLAVRFSPYQCAHGHLPSRCAGALRRVRR